MTRREQLLELRDQLAKATGPDWKINSEIARFVLDWKWHNEVRGSLGGGYKPAGWYEPDGKWHPDTPNWSGSIDAAVTLVPKQYTNNWTVGVVDEVRAPDDIQTRAFAIIIGNQETWASTAPLALCLARLEHELSQTDEAQK